MILEDVIRTSQVQNMRDEINAASPTPGYIEIHTAAYATLLVTNVFSADVLASITNGVGTFAAVNDGTVVASGVAAVYRIYDGNDRLISSGNVGLTGSGEDVEMTDTTLVAAEEVSFSGGTLTQDAGVA